MRSETRFSSYPPDPARILLPAWLMLAAISIATPALPRPPVPGPSIKKPSTRDIDLWQNAVDRMRAGDSYYSAMNQALRTTGPYALRPFLNFRLPLLTTATSLFPDDWWARAGLIGLSSLVAVLWVYEIGKRLGIIAAVAEGLLLLASGISALGPGAFLFHDLWTGLLIALSIWFYSRNRTASIACGLLALAIREHAIVFVLVMCFLACWQKRRREAAAWILGLIAFAGYLALHAYLVSRYVGPDDPAKTWLAASGWPFVISTARWTMLTSLLPSWGVGVVLALGLIGASGYPGETGARLALTLFAYLVTFMFVGNANNMYWGMLYSPPLSIGLVYSLPSLRDLVVAAAGHHRSQC